MTTYTTENAINFFIEKAQNVPHGNSTFIEHGMGVYNILLSFGAPEDVCLAGLYHSIYGNDFFDPKLPITRDQVRELIGLHAETLVYAFNTVNNRDEQLLMQEFNDELFFIAYANLKEQSSRTSDPELHELLSRFEARIQIPNSITEVVTTNEAVVIEEPIIETQEAINTTTEFEVETVNMDGKKIFVIDGLIERHQNDLLNSYCLNSRYTCDHSSNQFNVELDSRFVANMSRDEFLSTGLLGATTQISKILGKKLHLANFYINHYATLTNVSRHTDSSFENTYTILVFANKYWDDAWGGEIKFYSENSKLHNTIDFVPGRVVVFDSRIEHKVMPLTGVAKKSRFSIAIKGATDEGLQNLVAMYGNQNLVSTE